MSTDVSPRRLIPETARHSSIVPGEPGPGGYRRLINAAPEDFVPRNDLGVAVPTHHLRSLACFVQISDLHVADVQSPARAEFLDRLGDPDSPLMFTLGKNRTYRPQESLNLHVVEAMTHAIRRTATGPLTRESIQFVVSTGDATDSAQANELSNYIALLDGGEFVAADSGDQHCFDGVGAQANYDVRYWHPDGTPDGEEDDFPRARHGFPVVPGLLDACRSPFRTSGLGYPWYAVNGNHDALIGGIYANEPLLSELAVGSEKPFAFAGDVDLHVLLEGNEIGRSATGVDSLPVTTRSVAADPTRRIVTAKDWISAHLESPGIPKGHGLNEESLLHERAYYAFDSGSVRFLVLDTVNRSGGWQGSIDADQFAWLESELTSGHRTFYGETGAMIHHGVDERLFVLFSHHTLADLTNTYDAAGAHRYGTEEVTALLSRFPNVIAWFNGHTHEHAVSTVGERDDAKFWEVTTASHIDWPQQSRIIEIAIDDESGELVIGCEIIDHAGLVDPRSGDLDDPLTLAGWSRELAANAWQARVPSYEPIGRGEASDRNVLLAMKAPFAVGQKP